MSVIFVDTPFPRLKLGYTDNTQGFSEKEYAKFNLADNVGDQHLSVRRNRNLFQSHINADIKWLRQNHTAIVKSFDQYDGTSFCDGIFTDKPQQVCVVLTADCLPIILFDKKITKVAAVHVGWRGLSKNILQVALREFASLELIVWFGPCISANHYQVGQDVYDDFINQNKKFGQAFCLKSQNRYLLDMKLVARCILNDNHYLDIIDSDICTFSNKNYYSYRRKSTTGRQATFVWFE